MRLLITLLLTLWSFNAFSQFSIVASYNFNEDQFYSNRYIVGSDFGYNLNLGKRVKLYTSLGLKYAFKLKTKSSVYSNYEFENLEGGILDLVLTEAFLTREYKHCTLFTSPKIHVKYDLLNNSSIELGLFTGVNFDFKIYDKEQWSNVTYSNNFTETTLSTHIYKTNGFSLYNTYLPFGIEIRSKGVPIFLYTSYEISLRKVSFDTRWSYGEKRHDTIAVGIGIDIKRIND